MKFIIRDHLRRWRWLWLPILIAQFLIVGFSVNSQEGQRSLPIFFCQMAIFLGVFPLIINLQRGFARALLALPMTAKQIARAWWCVTVAIPALAIAATTALAVIIFSFAENQVVQQPELYALNCLMNALWLGAGFFVLTGMPVGNQTDWWSRTRGIFFGSLYGLSFSGGIFLFKDFSWANPARAEIFMVVAAVSTIAGWFRAEQMVMERGGFRLGVVTGAKKPGQYKAPAGFGGLPFLMQTTILRSVLIGFAILGVMTLFMGFGSYKSIHVLSSDSSIRNLIMNTMMTAISMPLLFVAMIQILPVVFQIRFLRTLPISPSALAATLVFLPLISMAALCLIIVALASPVTGAASILPVFKSFLMIAPLYAVAILLIVSRGLDVLTYFLIVFGCVLSSAMSLILHGGNIPLWGDITLSATTIGFSFLLTRRMLTRSSHAYRNPPAMMNAWGGGWR